MPITRRVASGLLSIVAVVLLAAPLPPVHAQAPLATLAGCIIDQTGAALPGVKVRIIARNVERALYSDAAGCYTVDDLPPSEYVVFATLPGFASVTRDQLTLAAGAVERVDLRMAVAPICECITFSSLADFWRIAEAIVRIRIVGHDATSAYASGLHYPRHLATVLATAKQRPGGIPIRKTLTFFQMEDIPQSEPYAVGQEFLVILRWSRTRDAFAAVAAFAVDDGRIRSGPLARYDGRELRQLIAEARALPD